MARFKVIYIGWFFSFIWRCIKDAVQTPHHCFGEIALFKENWGDFKCRVALDGPKYDKLFNRIKQETNGNNN